MKRFLVFFTIISAMFCSLQAFAWDPSGVWAIEGRSDTKMEISCKGDACKLTMQTNYGRYIATGYVKGDKLVVAYNYLTDTSFGFILFEQQSGKSMLQKTIDLNGKVAWTGKLNRQ